MKVLKKTLASLTDMGRWDIDFHLPPEGIRAFPDALLKRVDEVADVVRLTRDPTASLEEAFRYVDIASVEVVTGTVTGSQDLVGSEAPSRARKVLRAFDILVSTVRPTRGAVAVVPVELHNEIGSTGFTIVRPHADTNPFYLHFALRLTSTREQFRKWATGSSYPAILDEDVAKTVIPIPSPEEQDRIAEQLMELTAKRSAALTRIDTEWSTGLSDVTLQLTGGTAVPGTTDQGDLADVLGAWPSPPTRKRIHQVLEGLPPLTVDVPRARGRVAKNVAALKRGARMKTD